MLSARVTLHACTSLVWGLRAFSKTPQGHLACWVVRKYKNINSWEGEVAHINVPLLIYQKNPSGVHLRSFSEGPEHTELISPAMEETRAVKPFISFPSFLPHSPTVLFKPLGITFQVNFLTPNLYLGLCSSGSQNKTHIWTHLSPFREVLWLFLMFLQWGKKDFLLPFPEEVLSIFQQPWRWHIFCRLNLVERK